MRWAWVAGLATAMVAGCNGAPQQPVQIPSSVDDSLYADQVCVDYSYIRRPDIYCQHGLPGYHWTYEEYHSWDRPAIVVVGQPVNRTIYTDRRPTRVTVNHYYTGDAVPAPKPRTSSKPSLTKPPPPTRNPSVQRGGLGVRTTARAR